MPGNHDYAVSRLVTALRRDLSSADLTLPDEYRYASLPLCVIDAVYSIGVTYEVTRRTVTRWCEAMGWPRVRGQGVREHSLSDFLNAAACYTPDALASEVFQNRQRTSSRSGILKAEAATMFACALVDAGIHTICDVEDEGSLNAAAIEVRRIPGQGSGISWDYFRMLAGSDDHVKADRMVCRYIATALDEVVPTQPSRARDLLIAAAREMGETPRSIDYAVWQRQRSL